MGLRSTSKQLSGGELAAACLIILIAITLIYVVATLIFMVAWNAVVPSAFNGPTLDFGQSLALVIVISLIGNAFKSITARSN